MSVWVFTYLVLMNDPSLSGTEELPTEAACQARLKSWVANTLEWRERSGVHYVGSLCVCHEETRT